MGAGWWGESASPFSPSLLDLFSFPPHRLSSSSTISLLLASLGDGSRNQPNNPYHLLMHPFYKDFSLVATMTVESNRIQNEDVLFHFDDSEDPARWFDVDGPVSSYLPRFVRRWCRSSPSNTRPGAPNISALRFSSQASLSTHDGPRSPVFLGKEQADGVSKAKNPPATQPMLIRRTASPSQHDLFALSLEPAFSLSSRTISQSNPDPDPNNVLPMLSLSPSSFASASSSVDVLVQTPVDRAEHTLTLLLGSPLKLPMKGIRKV